jgi:2-oxoisovalerate dehydrogenase E1 component
MLRTMAAAAAQHGKVCVFLEPIALYMQKDLHAPNDGKWQFGYPPPDELMPLGEGRTYGASDDDVLTIVSYANGLWMSLRVQEKLRERGIKVRVFDLRWLSADADRPDQGTREGDGACSSSTSAAPHTPAQAR